MCYLRLNILILFSVLFLTSTVGIAQTSKSYKQFNIAVNQHAGFIMQHRKNLEHIVNGHVFGTELSVESQISNKYNWQRAYGLPQWGVALERHALGNEEQLGNAYGIYPYLKLYLVKKKRWALKTRLGWGIGYLTKVWNRELNIKNNLISSPFNICASIGNEANVYLTRYLTLQSGFRFTHYSNGAIKYPNLGVNIVSIYGGLSYSFGEKNWLNDQDLKHDDVYASKWNINLLFTGFRKGESAGIDKKYAVLNGSLNFQRMVSNKVFIQTGLDLFYDTWMEYHFLTEHISFNQDQDYIILGSYGAVGLNFGRLSSFLSVGVYLHGKALPNGSIYNRLTTQYLFTKRVFGSFSIKSHHFKADYFELGIGYRIWKK